MLAGFTCVLVVSISLFWSIVELHAGRGCDASAQTSMRCGACQSLEIRNASFQSGIICSHNPCTLMRHLSLRQTCAFSYCSLAKRCPLVPGFVS